VDVISSAGRYEVHVGVDLLPSLGARVKAAGLLGRVAVVSDETVFDSWGRQALDSLGQAGLAAQPLVVPPGESTKTLSSAEALFGGLIQGGFTRNDTLLALGGGVVGDLGGFVAATFHRGMALVQVPTTLLAQVDSSVGGKVAVDHPLGKNLIGAFHPARLVLADVRTLETLPARERWSGMAEVVKAALIQDEGLLELLEQRLEALATGAGAGAELAEVVRRAVQIKANVVSRDERETGPRMWLNFGHTFGHALETATGYGPLTHGEAVVQGMRVALALSVKLGRLTPAEAARAQQLLARFPPPPSWPAVAPAAVKAALFRDKKVQAGRLRFVVLSRLGQAEVEPELPPELVDQGVAQTVTPP
jgi:3-dehydroquinate synthase